LLLPVLLPLIAGNILDLLFPFNSILGANVHLPTSSKLIYIYRLTKGYLKAIFHASFHHPSSYNFIYTSMVSSRAIYRPSQLAAIDSPSRKKTTSVKHRPKSRSHLPSQSHEIPKQKTSYPVKMEVFYSINLCTSTIFCWERGSWKV
jgi:hypothetical protein